MARFWRPAFEKASASISNTGPMRRLGRNSRRVTSQIGWVLGRMALVKVFGTSEPEDSLVAAGFQIVHHRQPGSGKSVFIVAKMLVRRRRHVRQAGV